MKYIIRDLNNNLRAIEVEGFVPAAFICEAPSGDYIDSDLVESSPGVVTIDQSKKSARLAVEATEVEVINARALIEATNKHVIRQLETGIPMDPTIAAARAAAFLLTGA